MREGGDYHAQCYRQGGVVSEGMEGYRAQCYYQGGVVRDGRGGDQYWCYNLFLGGVKHYAWYLLWGETLMAWF